MATVDPGTIRCPRCGMENPPQAQFCMHCGSPLVQRCHLCGAPNSLEAHFCLRCGAPLRGEQAPERRVVSVLFADLVGSTSLVGRLDPETMRRLIGEYFAAMREEIQRHGGTVEKFIGDAVMAVFGVPAAHEDDPERAVRAALAMQHRMPALNAALGADLHIRIGIGTGEVVADPRAREGGEFMVTGDAVNLAARLQQHAPTDGIVVDDRTRRATRLVLRYLPLAPASGEMAGQARWQVAGVAERHEDKGLRAPLVGRDDEMQFLLALYRRVVDGRRHHLVTIIGSAGVGKTRLVEEVLAALADGADPPHVLRGRCPAYGEGLTYWPLAEMLKQECGIKDSDPATVAADKLRACVTHLLIPLLGAEESARLAADLAAILGVAARDGAGLREEQHRGRKLAEEGLAAVAREGRGAADRPSGDAVLRAFRSFLLARARERPLLVVFEDLHWAEESLLRLVEHLALRGVEAPVLTLCLARPELLERHPDWGGRIRNYTALALPPLPREEGRRLVGALLRGEAVPPEVRDAIAAKAEGNPLFIEEILRMLIDGGSLVRGERGWRLASPAVEIRIPETIHSILAARLDLLPSLERRVTQDAAVMGRVFWLGALLATGGLNAAEAVAALERLQERELVEERVPSSLAGEREFAFKHALVREAAYSTLPKAARSYRHLRFARWLQGNATQSADKFLEVLAYHYEQAWRYRFETGDKAADLARQAIAALRAAGARALSLRTLPEARRLHERALAVLRNSGLEEDVVLLLELLTGRSEVVKWMSQPAVLLEDTETVLRVAPTIGRDDLLARAWLNRAFAEYLYERLDASEEALGRALQLFAGLGDRQGEAEALEVLGRITQGLRGTLSKAHVAYRKAMALYRQLQDGQGLARTMAHLGRSLLDGGDLEEAGRVLAEGLALARQHHERISEAKCLMGLGVLAHLVGDSPTAIKRHEETIDLVQELGDAVGAAAVRRHLGMHYLRHRRADEAEREMRAAYALYREHAADEPAFILRGLAEVLLARGDLLAAADHAERALAGIAPEDPVGLATYGATLGKVRAAQGRGEEAEALFRRSLELLEKSEYRVDLALTLYKYGEALRLLGREAEGRQVLQRARQLFAQMGATGFAREIGALLPVVTA
ncbi:MAG: adenylate/guanylate cyclase domain-containing protein [Armatimonadota bacterium]|nr:adenylate/guanylate cyclase domain-containing protein [Armatimonadota bacterium]MDR7468867.1 adenylate/guanylate cyclase domain-containing protein [Armatimonadota bacterium]